MIPSGVQGLVLWLKADAGRFTTAAGSTAASADADPVGRWEDQSGSGLHVLQATDAARPTYRTTTRRSIRFDGVNDCLRAAGSRPDTEGSLLVAFVTGAALTSAQVLLSSADEGVANTWFEIGITADGRLYVESNAAGTKHTVYGSTTLEPSTAYHLALMFDGTDYYLQLSGIEENPLTIENIGAFAWFGDVAGADNIVVGGTVTSAGLVRPFAGDIMEVALYSGDIT